MAQLLMISIILILSLVSSMNSHDHNENDEHAHENRRRLASEMMKSGETPEWMSRQRLLTGAVCQSPVCHDSDPAEKKSTVGLEVILCGSGTPLPNTRARASTAIRAGDEYLIFDVGMGAELCLNAFRGENLAVKTKKIFLTHYHSDHTGGLPNFLTFGWNARPFYVDLYGPGIDIMANFSQGMRHFYAVDALQRELIVNRTENICEPVFHSPSEPNLSPEKYDTLLFNPKPFVPPPMDDKTRYVLYKNPVTNLTVEVFRVPHHIADPAVGYRITYKGKVVVISGDTIGYNQTKAVYNAAKNADILVHEMMNATFVQKFFGTNPDTRFASNCRIAQSHSTIGQVAAVARDAKVKVLIATHIIPPPITNQDAKLLKQKIQRTYKGPILIANDFDYFLI